MELQNFLFCMSIKTGAYVIGFMLVINLIFGIFHLHSIKILVKAAMAGIFAGMHFNDCEQTRMWYFIAFLINPLLMGLAVYVDQLHLGTMKSLRRVFMRGFSSSEACDHMTPEDIHRFFKSVEGCKRYERGFMKTVMISIVVLVILSVALYIHFALTLYTHWKNSKKSKEQGGCDNSEVD